MAAMTMSLFDGDEDDDNNNNNNNVISGNHEVKELQKTVILGTAHILRKVEVKAVLLQA
jgi:hypothetical protein